MSVLMRVALLFPLLLLSSCVSVPTLQRVHPMTLSLLINGDDSCSGTAIGPHALLTAAHCVKDLELLVDGDGVLNVVRVDVDDSDHALVVVKETFKSWATLGPEPKIGDSVFIYGNPGEMHDILRDGIVSWSGKDPLGRVVTLYDLNGYFGDSGSGFFDKNGRLVGVLSFVLDQHHETVSWKAMGSYALHFPQPVWSKDTSQTP